MTTPLPDWHLLSDPVYHDRPLIGIDEVGRGAWAGPVVAAAVRLPYGTDVAGVRDSKQLTPAGRERASRQIRRWASAIGIGWVASAEVDRHGLAWAIRESGLRALAGVMVPGAVVILDGSHNYLSGSHDSVAIVKADAKIMPVAAASVVAKVARDRYLSVLARQYPGFGFESHKGYGTKAHQAALAQLGPTAQHRRSWAPLARYADVDH